MRIRFVIFMAAMVCLGAAGQTKATDTIPVPASLHINTYPPGAIVFVDGDSVGISPVTLTGLSPGIVRIRILSPDVKNWLADPVVDSVSLGEGRDVSRTYSLARKYLIITSPSSAEVWKGDSVLGQTPLVIGGDWKHLEVRKKGYASVPLAESFPERGIISLNLKRLWDSPTTEEPPILGQDEDGSSLPLYLSGAAAILSGATAAYFKVKADNEYSNYLRSGNKAALDEVNRLDTAAAIALVATQVSMGLFTYFILSE